MSNAIKMLDVCVSFLCLNIKNNFFPFYVVFKYFSLLAIEHPFQMQFFSFLWTFIWCGRVIYIHHCRYITNSNPINILRWILFLWRSIHEMNKCFRFISKPFNSKWCATFLIKANPLQFISRSNSSLWFYSIFILPLSFDMEYFLQFSLQNNVLEFIAGLRMRHLWYRAKQKNDLFHLCCSRLLSFSNVFGRLLFWTVQFRGKCVMGVQN